MELGKLLEALPSVAASPLAFVAYVVVVGAWAVIALKVRRNRELLRHLEKLPPEQRLAALRLEMGGGVIVKQDVSASDWIRIRSRLYLIVGFVVLCATAVVLTVLAISARPEPRPKAAEGMIQQRAEAVSTTGTRSFEPQAKAVEPAPDVAPGPAPPGARAAGPAVALARSTRLGEPAPSDRHAPGKIESRREPGPAERRPLPGIATALERTDAAIAAISDIYAVSYRSARDASALRIAYSLPYLDKIRGAEPVAGVPFGLTSRLGWRFPELSFKIVNNTERTASINEIRVVVKRGRLNDEPIPIIFSGTNMNLVTRNEGWGDVIDPIWRLLAAPVDSCEVSFPDLTAAQLIKRASFSLSDQVPVLPIVDSGLRAAKEVCVFGALEYGEPEHRKTLRFHTTVYIGMISHEAMPATAEYRLVLRAGKPDTYVVPVDQQLAPGTADHFVLIVTADRSASFDLEISLGTTGSPVTLPGNVSLDLLVPRSVGQTLVTRR